MRRYTAIVMFAFLAFSLACSERESVVQQEAPPPVATTTIPPSSRPMRAGPPEFSRVEPELVRYADWYCHMTALQEQEALARDSGPLDDFGRKLVGRSFRFTGRVSDVERANGKIIVNLDYAPRGTSGRVREPGEALQSAFYSRGEFARRRMWRVSIELPDNELMRKSAEAWGKSRWLAFDGRVESTEGFTLKREGTTATFASNHQRIVATSSGVAEGDFIGPHSRVALIVDCSGSMTDYARYGLKVTQRILRSLPSDARFQVMRTPNDAVASELQPCSASNVSAACAVLDDTPIGDSEDLGAAVKSLLPSDPTHLIVVTDKGSAPTDADVATLFAEHPQMHAIVILIDDDGDPQTTRYALSPLFDSRARTFLKHASVFEVSNGNLGFLGTHKSKDACDRQVADAILPTLARE
ncbi:MAG TPA: hypothetical protein P5081_02645 [Phycisphaerae bacterium]|nr:hypothetical protein [Phycisphaerae bacterium]HRW51756.1 hypothetical protein [Phycisphaerae bacterium]